MQRRQSGPAGQVVVSYRPDKHDTCTRRYVGFLGCHTAVDRSFQYIDIVMKTMSEENRLFAKESDNTNRATDTQSRGKRERETEIFS